MSSTQRYTADDPCPICGGHQRARKGTGERCHGYHAEDGAHVYCSREEHAGRLAPNGSGLYRHWIGGLCDCGADHREPSDRFHAHGNGHGQTATVARPRPKAARKTRRVAKFVHDYTDRSGEPGFQVVRSEYADDRKEIAQRRHDPDRPGVFVYSIKDVPRPLPLYNLPIIAELSPGETLLVVEGEKHADRLVALGFNATTSAMGAGKASQTDWSPVRGLDLVLMPDNDPVGRDHMADVADRCRAAGAKSVRLLELPGLPEKGDVLDWLDAGGSPEELRPLVAEAPEAPNQNTYSVGQNGHNGQKPPSGVHRGAKNGDSVHSVHSVHAPKGSADADWPSLRLTAGDILPDFPADVFPGRLADYCRGAAAALGTAVDFVGGAMIGAASGAIGRTVRVEVKVGTWYESANVNVALTGHPGFAKSPTLSQVLSPIRRRDKAARLESKQRRKEWDDAARKHKADPEKHSGPEGDRPKLEAFRVEDITRETLAGMLEAIPRGLMVDQDELSGLFASFNEYKGGKGADRQFWLKAFNVQEIPIDRNKGEDSRYVCAYIPFVGGLTPDMLGSVREDRCRDDGMVDRVLFVYPDASAFPDDGWPDDDLNHSLIRAWETTLDALMSMQLRDDGTPHTVAFDPDAIGAIKAHCREMFSESKQPGVMEFFSGHYAKSKAHLIRLSLILSRLRIAFVEGGDPTKGPIKLSDVEAAYALLRYFMAHFVKATAELSGGRMPDGVRSIVRWLSDRDAEDAGHFTERELYREVGRFRRDREGMDESLRWLAERHAIRPMAGAREPEKVGRSKSPCWSLHPELPAYLKSYRSRTEWPEWTESPDSVRRGEEFGQ